MAVPPIVVPNRFRVIAHRGASGYAPENTLAAFRLAREMGAREVELDVQLSADGVVVVCHDITLERYGYGEVVVEDMDSRKLLSLDMGTWFSPRFAGERMATLRGLFEEFRDEFTWHVEIKGEGKGLEDAVAGLIGEFRLAERVVVTSFDPCSLNRMYDADPKLRRGWLLNMLHASVIEDAGRAGLFQLCPSAEHVTREDVAAAKRVVREVRAWGLSGTPEHVRELIHRVVDAGCDGMTIDRPDWARHETH